MASNSPDTTTSTTRYAYKKLPTFDPAFYRSWSSEVRDAFTERTWTDYLIPSDKDAASLDPLTTVQAKAFLTQSIPYGHRAGLEGCTKASEIWLALEQRYAAKSREDELRLEGQLLDLKKLPTDTIDQHIAKFDVLIAAVIAQQPIGQQYDESKKNSYFLRTLETANIPGEDWKGFVTFLGKGWVSLTTHALFAEARTYYNSHLLPLKATSAAPLTEPKVLAASTTPSYGSTFIPPTSNELLRSNGHLYGFSRGA
jgi:hypothetical protein